MTNELLQPAALLVAWTLVMLFWMAGTQLPALKKVGIDMNSAVGGRGQDIDPALPPSVAWKSHNYSHLMEQPTIFYAAVAILALSDGAGPLAVALAWGYAILRIAHSLWQATVNRIPVRFMLFLLSSGCLVGLSVLAIAAVFA